MFTAHLAKAFEKPSYRRYWLAYSLSALGFELVTFALMVILFDITGTAVSMGAFTAIYMFCLVVFGPPAGIYIDRWNRKRIFIVCNILLALLISSQQFLTGVFWIYGSWFFASLVLVFLRPARVALITNLFQEKDYLQANSAFMMSLNFSKIGGPLIGGMRESSLFMTVLSVGGALGSLLAGGMGNRFSHHPRPFSFPWDCSRC